MCHSLRCDSLDEYKSLSIDDEERSTHAAAFQHTQTRARTRARARAHTHTYTHTGAGHYGQLGFDDKEDRLVPTPLPRSNFHDQVRRVYMHACTCVYVCVPFHACMHACMYVCMYVCAHTHTIARARTRTRTRTRARTHTHAT